MPRVLHGDFRSSAAYRVRIALNLKGLDCERVSVHLRHGEQRGDAFLALNPQGMVPALVDGDAVLTQSPAILEYLDEAYPDTPRLLPVAPVDRARVRALAAAVACDIHPLNNLRVLQYIQGPMGGGQDTMVAWYNHWIAEGFRAIERMLAGDPRTGRFCHGDTPSLADICLVPQVFNSARHALDLDPYPTIRRIAAACDALPAFADAHPARQPDAE
jgi:maleylacetoacetate isomerase